MDHKMQSLSGKAELSCAICGKLLKHKYSLERHIRVIHGGFRPFACECGKAFATQEQFTRHMNSKHTKNKPYPCQKGCSKSFASYTARAYHHSAIHDRVKFICPIIGCGKQYSAKIHLKNHLKQPHDYSLWLNYLINRLSPFI